MARFIDLWRELTKRRVTRLLLLSNGLFFLFFVGAFFWPISIAAPPSIQSQRELQALQVVPAQRIAPDLTGFKDQPLFHVSRKHKDLKQPDSSDTPVVQTVPPSQLYRVTGIMKTSSGSSVAYIFKIKSGESFRVSDGGSIEDWTVMQVQPTGVVLEKNGQNVVLQLAQ